MRFLLITFLSFSIVSVSAQSNSQNAVPDYRTPSSLNPGKQEKEPQKLSPKRKFKLDDRAMIRIYGGKVESRKEFEARMVKTVKEIRKREREMKKPQYSDPMYFGHKRPPKKHKAGKLKYCKECGIRH